MALRLCPPPKFIVRINKIMHLKCLAKNLQKKKKMIATIINKKYILCILDLEPYKEYLKEKKQKLLNYFDVE